MKKILFSLFAFILMIHSCGIYSFTGASIPPEAKTVSVNYFENMAELVQPTVSPLLTDKLQDKLSSQTTLQLASADGDLQFSGEVTGYRTAPAGIVAGATASQQRLTITVHVVFVNYYDEKASFDASFSRFADFDSNQNLYEVENTLIDEIMEQIVEDIFNKAVVNW